MTQSTKSFPIAAYIPFQFRRLSHSLIVLLIGILTLSTACAGPAEAAMQSDIIGGQAPRNISFSNLSRNADEFHWDFGDGETTVTNTTEEIVTHQYEKAGIHTVTLRAVKNSEPPESSTATLTVTIDPGNLNQLRLEPPVTSIGLEEELEFTTVALDMFDNPITDLSYVFVADEEAGQVSDTGIFTAGTLAGSFTDGFSVEVTEGSITKTATAKIIIEPGPLNDVEISPASLVVQAAKGQALKVVAYDEFDNTILDLPFIFQADAEAGEISVDGNFVAATVAGTYENSVVVEVTQDSLTKTAMASVVVEPGPLDHVGIDAIPSAIEAGKQHQVKAVALDEFENPIPDVTFVYESNDSAAEIDDNGLFTVPTQAGKYSDALSVLVSQGAIVEEVSIDIVVEHGPLAQTSIEPTTVTLEIGDTQTFTTESRDVYGNIIPEADVTWSQEVGTIDDSGVLTAGTVAGVFEKGAKVSAQLGADSADATSVITVNPGALDAVTVVPVEIVAGSTHRIEAFATDEFGNVIGDLEVSLTSTNNNAGSITQSEFLQAGEVVGVFESVEGGATEGDVIRTSTATVEIVPDSLSQIVIGPMSIDLGMGMTQQFVAVGADQFGNRISGIDISWSVESGGGSIDSDGLFTAGTDPDSYKDTVMATVVQGEDTITAAATVNVEPDRIAFVRQTGDESADMYLMEPDGSNVQQITTTGVDYSRPSWSPNGRRIAFDRAGDINSMADDGTWDFIMLSESFGVFEPAWSPDGTKIAFQSWEHDSAEIYVMDIDGGNRKRLTKNSSFEDLPSWSPDGKKIVYVKDDTSGHNKIYVMNADGSDQKKLTDSRNETEMMPQWSPDGTQIAYQSARPGENWVIRVIDSDGGDALELMTETAGGLIPAWSPDGKRIVFSSFRNSDDSNVYIMDSDGKNVERLTSEDLWEGYASWAPRKQGVEISEGSIIIPDSSVLVSLSVADVTASVLDAVVRIETDLGSASGFVIDADGLILTNNHVVRDTEEITVFLEDGSEHTGEVRGRDLVRDLALIEIDAKDLQALTFGDVGKTPLASELIVLGFPLGELDVSVTRGVVSAIKPDTGRNIFWVQTDAAVNPGNSGGPVLNLQGEVIGVVDFKIVSTVVEGVAFSISSNTVLQYLERLKADEVITN